MSMRAAWLQVPSYTAAGLSSLHKPARRRIMLHCNISSSMKPLAFTRSIQRLLKPAVAASMPEVLAQLDQTLRKALGAAGRPLPNDVEAAQAEASTSDRGRFLDRKFSCAAGERRYKLYVPQKQGTGPMPLLVMLHGCRQNPVDFARGTQMNALAEELGFLVVYPEQPANANGSNCWNWFDARHQGRGAGEAAILAGLTQDVMRAYPVAPDQVFVAGLSAGAAMAVILGVTYPDIFSAVGAHSGLPYRAATDVPSAFAAMKGQRAAPGKPDQASQAAPAVDRAHRAPRVIVFQGDADQTVSASNASSIVDDASRALAADGSRLTPVQPELVQAGGRTARVSRFVDAEGATALEQWMVSGAGHAWSGGHPSGSFTSPEGPNASREMLRFFLNSRR
jgi:poly(hydroxyalkanoate) depolymerase family esterase